jgi:hypothetical protein
MNEYIEINLRRNDRPLRITRQVPRGIELNERDPIARTVQIGVSAADPVTEYRMRRVRQLQGWEPGQFKLIATVEDGSLVLRGIDRFSLPEGGYKIGLNIEAAKTRPTGRVVRVSDSGNGTLELEVFTDDRDVVVDLSACDAAIQGVLDRSTIDEESASDWLDDADKRPARKACLLNLLATLRVRPTLSNNLLGLVRNVFWTENDRVYATVDRELFDRFQELAADPAKPFYREGYPHSDTHLRLLEHLPESASGKALFPRESLVSFRGEGQPSLQAVILKPPAGVDYTYADFDLDLGNPLQDAVGLVVHMGELLGGKATDHLDLRARLGKGAAKPYLYYTIT